jgi:hypothetical protein
MAHWIRFEIYVPVTYTVTEVDPERGAERRVRRGLDDQLLRKFVSETIGRYRGMTQANPLSTALYKGWWQSGPKTPIDVDYLTYLFGLVAIDQSDEATKFFSSWKERFEKEAHQQVILLIYYPVQTVGDFF